MTGPLPLSPLARAMMPSRYGPRPQRQPMRDDFSELSGLYNTEHSGTQNPENIKDTSYGAMTPAEFNAAAQSRANGNGIGPVSANTIAGAFSGIPGGGFLAGMLDDSMFNGEQSKRAQDFVAAGQPMPDEAMAAAANGGTAGPGDPNAGNGEQGGLGGNRDGGFYGGGMVRPQDLKGPDPSGPDQGYIPVMAGEVVLNQPQQMALAKALRGKRR